MAATCLRRSRRSLYIRTSGRVFRCGNLETRTGACRRIGTNAAYIAASAVGLGTSKAASLSRNNDTTKAINYCLSRWDAFTRFLDDRRIIPPSASTNSCSGIGDLRTSLTPQKCGQPSAQDDLTRGRHRTRTLMLGPVCPLRGTERTSIAGRECPLVTPLGDLYRSDIFRFCVKSVHAPRQPGPPCPPYCGLGFLL